MIISSRLINLTIEKGGWATDPRNPEGKEIPIFGEKSTVNVFNWTPGTSVNPEKLSIKEFPYQAMTFYDGSSLGTEERTAYHDTILTDHANEKWGFPSRASLSENYQPYSRNKAFQAMMKDMGITKKKGIAGLSPTRQVKHFIVSAPLHSPRDLPRTYGTGITFDFDAGQPDTAPPGTLMRKDLAGTMRDFRNHDAFVFKSDKKESGLDEEARKAHEVWKFMYLNGAIIHKVLDPEGRNKTIILQGDDWDDTWQQIVTLFNRGARSAIVRASSSSGLRIDDETIAMLKEARKSYRRVPVEHEEITPMPEIDTGKFNVCVLLSAGLEGVFEDKSKRLGYLLQKEDMGLVYGAADSKMMGGTLHGGLLHEKRTRKEATVVGSTTTNIATTENSDGARPKQIDERFYYHAAFIEPRKEFLYKNSHAFLNLEGGVGTLDELVTYLWYKHNQPEIVKGKPWIITESAL